MSSFDGAKGTPVSDADIKRVQVARVGSRYPAPEGWFGAYKPLAPIAQDAAHGRQFDYPVGFNQRITPKLDPASATGITYPELRALADSLDILRLVIETRKDQVEAFDWEIMGLDDAALPDSVTSAISAILRNPTPEHNWASWLRMMLEELFVIDAVAILPRYNRGEGIIGMELIDGATIKRVIDDGGRTPFPPDPAYQQVLKGVPATDYTTDELIYAMRNPRVSKLYGYSPVEQILMTVNIALRRQVTQLQYFTEGNIPEAIAGTPDTWNPDQIRKFQDYFDSMMTGQSATRSRVRFLPIDPTKFKETRPPDIKSAFDDWLARVVCYAFSVPPTPFIAQMNKATADTAQEASLKEGLMPILSFVKRLMDFIIQKHLGYPSAQFKWRLKTDNKPLDQATIDQIYLVAGVKDAAEIREDLGLPPKEIVPPAQATLMLTQDHQQKLAETNAKAGLATPVQNGDNAPPATAPPASNAPPANQQKIDAVAELVKAAISELLTQGE